MDSTASLTSFEFENSQSPSAKRPLKKRRRTIEALKGYSNRGEAPQASVEAEAEEVGSSHRLRQAGRVRRLKDLVDNSQSEKKGRDSKNNGSNAEFLQETTDDSIKDQDQAAAPRRLRQDRQRRRTQDFVTKYRNSVTSEHEVENEHVDERDATEDSVQDPEEPAASLRRLRSSKQRRRTEDFVAKYSSVRSAEELEKGNTDEKEVTEDSLKHQEESAVSLRRLRRANRRRTQDFVDKYRNVEPSVTRRDHEKNREPSNEDTDSLISHQEEPAASHRFLRRSSRRQTQDYVDKYHNVEPVEKSLFKNAVPSLDISEESINCQVEPEASPRLLRSRRQRRTQDHVDKYRGVEPVEEEDHEATLEPSPLVVHAKNARARSGHSTVDVAPLYRGVSLDTSRMTVQTTSASFFQREPLVTSTPMAHTRNARASTSEVETHQQLEQQHYEDDRQEHGDNGQEDEDNEHRENGVVGNVSLLAESDGKGCDYYKGMGFEAAFRRFLADKEIGQDRQQAVDEVLRLPEATQLDDNVFKRPLPPAPRKTRVNPSQSTYTFGASYVRWQIERYLETKATLGSAVMPTLMDISERFCHKIIKYLGKRLKEQNRTRCCLADVKALMLEFGLIDSDDPTQVKFIRDILEILPDPADHLKLLPETVLDGKPGSTSLPSDLWERVPKETRKRRKTRLV